MVKPKPIRKTSRRLWATLKQRFWEERRVSITASSVAACILLLRLTGLLQSWELAAFDQLIRLRPPQSIDQRVLIVGIDEETLQQVGKWPIPDGVMAQLLQKLQAQKPRAIGLDIYRDLPVEPGHVSWVETARRIPNLIGIERLKDKDGLGVSPPPVLHPGNQFGFNNTVVDADGKVRRSLLYWHVDGKSRTSFVLKLALIYLKAEGITPTAAPQNPQYLQLGQGVFRRFEPNDGAYMGADAGGYQILANFRGASGSFRTVSLSDILTDQVPPDWIRDRIVLIGSTAVSLKDFFYTPYSIGLIREARPTSGVELQANFISQILDAAQGKPVLMNSWAEPLEWLWILGWSWLGASLVWQVRSPIKSAFSIILAGFILAAISYLALFSGWWIPLIPPLITLACSALAIVGHIIHLQDELNRSKEFLQNVINTIPDPIFVKDKQHRWIVLNEAYCLFLGHPLDTLLEKSDYDFFPSHEAETFWQQDEQVFQTGKAYEHEEEFTDARGNTHLIATKRSLHKDAAGNLFLVGVIRDITERKQLEEQLKRTAAELVRSNTELKLSEHHLRYLADHDPLTGLANRKLFQERLSQSIEWARLHNQMVALLFLDLDGFKQINDTLGHDTGDLLLKTVAQRLTASLRGSDTISRLGGDEFTIILPAIPSVADVEKVAGKVLTTVTQPLILNEQTVQITTSIGISLFPQNGDRIDTLIKEADTAMYRAKQQGKNKYEFSQIP